MPQLFAVITGIAEYGVLFKSQFVYFVKEHAKVLIQLGDGAVIADQKLYCGFLRQTFTFKIGAKPV